MCVLMQQLDNEPELSMSRYYFRETNPCFEFEN